MLFAAFPFGYNDQFIHAYQQLSLVVNDSSVIETLPYT